MAGVVGEQDAGGATAGQQAAPATTRATPARRRHRCADGADLTGPASAASPSPRRVSACSTTPSSRRVPVVLVALPWPRTASAARPPPPCRGCARPARRPTGRGRPVSTVSAIATTRSVGPGPSGWPGPGWWGRPGPRCRCARARRGATASSASVRTAATAVRTRAVNARGCGPSHGPTGPVPCNGSAGSASSTVASTRRARSSVSPSVSAATTRARAPSISPRSSAPRVRVSTRHNRRAACTSRSACQRARPVAAATSSATISSRSCTVSRPLRVAHRSAGSPSCQASVACTCTVIASIFRRRAASRAKSASECARRSATRVPLVSSDLCTNTRRQH